LPSGVALTLGAFLHDREPRHELRKKVAKLPLAMGRLGLVIDRVLLGFWRFVIG
jgi:hypothetical protein